MDLRHLRYFVAVAEERHFTRAAERLGIKQPPLSLQIKQLEQELGTPLFRRLTRGVELTEPGTLLLEEARQILEQVERTKANVRNRARGETGRIRVGFAGATYFQPRVPGLFKPIGNAIRTCCCRQCKATLLTWSRLCGTVRLTWPLSGHRSETAKDSQFIRSSRSRCGSCCRRSTRKPASAPCRSPPWRRKRLYFSPGQSGRVSTTASSQVASVRDLARSWDKKPRRFLRSYTWWRQGSGYRSYHTRSNRSVPTALSTFQ